VLHVGTLSWRSMTSLAVAGLERDMSGTEPEWKPRFEEENGTESTRGISVVGDNKRNNAVWWSFLHTQLDAAPRENFGRT
jgi:hypothetical protein